MNSFLDFLFLDTSIQVFDTLSSTNDIMKELVSKESVKEGQIILTEFQTKGKGQIKNSWFSSPRENLLFSIYLKPSTIPIESIFLLNKWVSISIIQSLNQVIEKAGFNMKCAIKWPNDILLNNKKIGGILIENSLRGHHIEYSIVGIGLNINETSFPYELIHASSFRSIFNQEWNRQAILKSILETLETQYLKLISQPFSFSDEAYESHLYRIHEPHSFKIHENIVQGTIRGITSQGKLKVEIEGEIKTFYFKEIELVY